MRIILKQIAYRGILRRGCANHGAGCHKKARHAQGVPGLRGVLVRPGECRRYGQQGMAAGQQGMAAAQQAAPATQQAAASTVEEVANAASAATVFSILFFMGISLVSGQQTAVQRRSAPGAARWRAPWQGHRCPPGLRTAPAMPL